MSKYSEFFLNSQSNVVKLEVLEISHPNFTKTYRIVRNKVDGITINSNFYEYYPLQIKPLGFSDDLDQEYEITLGDLGEILPTEIDAISGADGFIVKPTVLYSAYRSDDLSEPLLGPVILEVIEFNFNREGATFKATAPLLNINKTGQIYAIDRFPMLRGFL